VLTELITPARIYAHGLIATALLNMLQFIAGRHRHCRI
jgi:mannose/fructose-specific phosphotransferase system component IIA